VDNKLNDIMKHIHEACVNHGSENGSVNYVKGANIAGFIKIADSMLDQGIV
jgi:glutamate dehydrogenase (NADP+)